jgi:phage/plasmid-like protein (TIGR03299 family)
MSETTVTFFGGKPWEKLGAKINAAPTTEEGIIKSGLNWAVRLDSLYTTDGAQVDAYATRRVEDGKILGVVGPNYRVLQNRDAFKFFDPFLAAGEAELDTAGSLQGGKRLWVLAKIKRGIADVVPGDPVESHILLSNSHDGTLSVRVGFTPIRVVCANTLHAAHKDGESRLIRIKHTQSMGENLAAVRDVMDAARNQFAATVHQYRRLANKDINGADVKKYIRQVFEVKEAEADLSTRMKNILKDVEERVYIGRGNNLPGVRGTLWGAYQGITDYLSHGRGSDADSRLNSLWFGDSANINKRAFETALALAL